MMILCGGVRPYVLCSALKSVFDPVLFILTQNLEVIIFLGSKGPSPATYAKILDFALVDGLFLPILVVDALSPILIFKVEFLRTFLI